MHDIATTLRDQIDDFKPYITLIQMLRNPGMKDRHFDELSVQTGIHMALTPSLTFRSLLMLGIEEFEELVITVAETAAKEYATEKTLNTMMAEWENIVMEMLPYKTTGAYTFCFMLRIIYTRKRWYLCCYIYCLYYSFSSRYNFWFYTSPKKTKP